MLPSNQRTNKRLWCAIIIIKRTKKREKEATYRSLRVGYVSYMAIACVSASVCVGGEGGEERACVRACVCVCWRACVRSCCMRTYVHEPCIYVYVWSHQLSQRNKQNDHPNCEHGNLKQICWLKQNEDSPTESLNKAEREFSSQDSSDVIARPLGVCLFH